MVRDIRTSFLRYFSSSELFELMDFVEVVKDLISYYICPRLDPGIFKVDADMPWMRGPSRESSMNGGFVDRTCWGRIIKTYAKLGPEEMMHYVKNICSFPRTRLIRDIEDRHPNFTVDQESIQVSIRCVLEERLWLDSPPSFPDDSVGGIIDFDDERDDERVARGDDASADGWPPGWLGSKLSASRSLYSPRGDDGHDAEGNPLYQAEMLRRMQRVLLETRARKADVSIDS
ncbi:hypothetical protein ESCO_001045 [Escovopsis weberi]|uniref:Uncharacterized protein n=1 Tax=Escovopsis weberi TaxID=150374 RepID=A0A0M8MSH0_ESCWE|nr:hypothetical protein ESCO_001045 [Escovopsis weberi]